MKEIKQYKCERCGTLYADKTNAMECEKNHKSALIITKEQFMSKGNNASGHPLRIVVKMENGEEIICMRK